MQTMANGFNGIGAGWKTLSALLVANEIRGLILAGPVLWGMAQASTAMALWVGVCALAGVVLSVVAPAILVRALQSRRWLKASIAGGVVVGMVVLAFVRVGGV